jgi:hypothetical protein
MPSVVPVDPSVVAVLCPSVVSVLPLGLHAAKIMARTATSASSLYLFFCIFLLGRVAARGSMRPDGVTGTECPQDSTIGSFTS